MIKLSPTEIHGERIHGERTDLTLNLELLADYLAALDTRFRRALEPQPRGPARDQALMALEVIPAWRQFVLGMAAAARRDQAAMANFRELVMALVQSARQQDQAMEEEPWTS